MKKQFQRHHPVSTYSRPKPKQLPANRNGRHLPSKPNRGLPASFSTPFTGNITDKSGKFHTRGNDVTAFVKRKLTMKDCHGNTVTADETQFFTSSKDAKGFYYED